jgi:hypothetical protein
MLIFYRVELWTCDADKKTTSWKCAKRGSPGNMQDFEDIVVTDGLRDAPVVMALAFTQESGRCGPVREKKC